MVEANPNFKLPTSRFVASMALARLEMVWVEEAREEETLEVRSWKLEVQQPNNNN